MRRSLTMTAVPEALLTSKGQGLKAAMAMMYAPNPLPNMVKKHMKTRDLQTNIRFNLFKLF